jgi:hypothetical protein
MTLIDTSKTKFEVLFTEGKYTIVRFEGLPEEALTFLKEIDWGSEGAVYQNMDTESVFRLIPEPHLIAILEANYILATGVFCHTKVHVGIRSYPCYYIRFFAASPLIKGKGIMKKYTARIMELIAEGVTEKTIFFANVERGNRASYSVVKNSGYDPLFVVKTHGFSRFFPRKNDGVELISTKTEKAEISELLKVLYDQYSLVQRDTLFSRDNYHVIRKDGQIVAGCQYFRVHWVIRRMPGWSGKMIMRVLPVIPLLNKLFNPKKFIYLAFDAIYVRPGYEKELQSLFKHLLASEKLNSAIFWLGETCDIRKTILSGVKLGLLHRFVEKSDVYCMVHTVGLSEEEKKELEGLPAFAPAFDYI